MLRGVPPAPLIDVVVPRAITPRASGRCCAICPHRAGPLGGRRRSRLDRSHRRDRPRRGRARAARAERRLRRRVPARAGALLGACRGSPTSSCSSRPIGLPPPARIPALVAPIAERGVELVLGSEPGRRPISEKLVTRLIETVYRHRWSGVGPVRAMRFPALIALGMSDRGDGWDVEMLVRAVKLGLTCDEVVLPAGLRTARPRSAGARCCTSFATQPCDDVRCVNDALERFARDFAAGTVLFEEGQPGDYMYVVAGRRGRDPPAGRRDRARARGPAAGRVLRRDGDPQRPPALGDGGGPRRRRGCS